MTESVRVSLEKPTSLRYLRGHRLTDMLSRPSSLPAALVDWEKPSPRIWPLEVSNWDLINQTHHYNALTDQEPPTGAHITIFSRRPGPLAEAKQEIVAKCWSADQEINAVAIDMADASKVSPPEWQKRERRGQSLIGSPGR